jgi:hypothetical protein
MSALTTHTYSNPREKEKEKEKEKKLIKETPTSDPKSRNGKEQDHLKKTSLRPLRQGPRLDVDGPYDKLLTVNISSMVALYNEIHACFRC